MWNNENRKYVIEALKQHEQFIVIGLQGGLALAGAALLQGVGEIHGKILCRAAGQTKHHFAALECVGYHLISGFTAVHHGDHRPLCFELLPRWLGGPRMTYPISIG